MRKLQTLAKAFGIISIALFPAVMAISELGFELGKVERMHARRSGAPGADLEMVGLYETKAGEEGVRMRPVAVKNQAR